MDLYGPAAAGAAGHERRRAVRVRTAAGDRAAPVRSLDTSVDAAVETPGLGLNYNPAPGPLNPPLPVVSEVLSAIGVRDQLFGELAAEVPPAGGHSKTSWPFITNVVLLHDLRVYGQILGLWYVVPQHRRCFRGT